MHQRIDEVKTFPGLHDVLGQLHARGHQMFVMSSNSQQNVEHFLRTHNLENYFDDVYGGIGLFSKTRALRKIMHRNKLRPEDCYYIGDEMRDVQAAKKARMRAVAVAWGYNSDEALRKQAPFALAQQPSDFLTIFR